MAVINKLDNAASITYNGSTINSNTVSTLLLVAPTVVKAVDRIVASAGETLTYTVTVTNLGLGALTNVPFTDPLPAGSTFVTGSFTVNSAAATPVITGNTLTYTIPSIAALGSAVIRFQVLVVGGSV